MRLIAPIVSLLVFFTMAGEVYAQGGGRGGGPGGGMGRGRDREERQRVSWADDIQDALKKASEKKTFVIVYVRPLEEEEDPQEFRNRDMADASRDKCVFVQIPYDKEDEWIRRWGVRRAGTILGADMFGNDFSQQRLAMDRLRLLLKSTPEAIDTLEAWLRKTAKGLQEDRTAEKAAQDILKKDRWGYDEVKKALAYFRSMWEEKEHIVSLFAGAGIDRAKDHLNKIARSYAGTPLGYLAQIRLAGIVHHRDPSAALSTIRKLDKIEPLFFAPEMGEADKVYDAIVKKGDEKVDKAFAASDRKTLTELKKKYAKTSVAGRAAEALRNLK